MKNTIISVVQQKGGSGKTTIVAHIAVGLAQKGKKVLLIDIDPQGSLKKWFELRTKNLDEKFILVKFLSIHGWMLSSEIINYKESYDYIIIDCPPHVESETKSAIRSADLLLIPMQPNPTDLWATENIINLAKFEKANYKIILNRYNPNSKTHKIVINKLDEKNILKNHLSNRIGFASTMLDGCTIIEKEPRNPGSFEIENMIKEITNILKKKQNL